MTHAGRILCIYTDPPGVRFVGPVQAGPECDSGECLRLFFQVEPIVANIRALHTCGSTQDDNTTMPIDSSRTSATTARQPSSPMGHRRTREIRRGPLRCFAIAALLFAAVAGAAPIQPPLHVLFDPLNVLVSATLVEAEPSGRLVFQRREVIHGEPTGEPVPDTIELMAPAWVVPTLSEGQPYLVGYSPYARDPQRVRRMIVSPGGSRLIQSPGIEPALFPDTAEYRNLLVYAEGGHVADRPDAMAHMLTMLDEGPAPLRALAAAQFALDPKLHAQLDRTSARRLRAAAVDPALSWSGRAWLLDLAHRRSDIFPRRWLRRTGRDIIARTPVTGFGEPVNAGDLVGAAFLHADLEQWTVPDAALVRWLASDSHPLAERALLQMRRQDPALERSSLDIALASEDVPAGNRHFLEEHRRRLDVMTSRQKGE
jgi:hypothetical protein